MSEGLEALKETAIQIVEALYGKDEPLRNHKINELLETRQFKCIEKELKEYEQHKAIEQELGIDLIKLSQIRKAIIKKEKCYVIGWNDKIWIYQLEKIDIINNLVIGIYDGCRHSEELKDYGKTWALTREELEK